ncbi:hypothetical protein UFOVP116_91 [uncultured Caudovirales phage]|uniref:Uncharacterized protein n=1 Tax=uncultured Caudovirales phage TaxID=2100421 RepID=A0A6J5L6L3_9CAUD|nr:hypothetical protein UFOVP116_91 [uncultured Caudovirales phage]
MIKTSQQHFNRTIQAIHDTEKQIAARPNASFVADYKNHIVALKTLLAELEVCNNMSVSEMLESSNAIFARMSQLKNRVAVQ